MFWMLFTILFATVSGPLTLLTKTLRQSKLRPVLAVILQAVVTAGGWVTVLGGDQVTGRFYFTDTLWLSFASDALARFFCAIIVTAWLLVTVYAGVYMKHEGREERFFLFAFLTEAALLGAAFSDGLIGMYLFYEMVTLLSMPLVLHSLSKEAVSAAKKYLYYSVAGAFMALFGIFVLNAQAGALAFIPGGSVAQVTPLMLVAVFLMCLGFGAKAGLYPLHNWLPTAHPVAPAPASALLSGVITKAGVLAIIRTVFYTVGADKLAGTWVQITLLILSLLSVLMGSMLAYREKVLKKRLAYSSVSQLSYVLTGLFLFSSGGLDGALWQILFHAAVKVGLFLCVGTCIFLYGKTRVEELNGLGKKMPVTFLCFTVLSLSLIGIPPTGGFFSKWYLATAALNTTRVGALNWIVPVVLLVSALLTAGYLLEIAITAFFKKEAPDTEKTVKEPPAMWLAPLVLAVVALLGGILAQQTGGLLSTVVASLLTR